MKSLLEEKYYESTHNPFYNLSSSIYRSTLTYPFDDGTVFSPRLILSSQEHLTELKGLNSIYGEDVHCYFTSNPYNTLLIFRPPRETSPVRLLIPQSTLQNALREVSEDILSTIPEPRKEIVRLALNDLIVDISHFRTNLEAYKSSPEYTEILHILRTKTDLFD